MIHGKRDNRYIAQALNMKENVHSFLLDTFAHTRMTKIANDKADSTKSVVLSESDSKIRDSKDWLNNTHLNAASQR